MLFFRVFKLDFSVKVKWRMIFDRNPLFITLQDKYLVREYASSKGIKTPDLYFVTDRPETIPFGELPSRYLIKANHGCKWNILCFDSKFYRFKDGKDLVNQDGSFLNKHSASKCEIDKAEVILMCKKWLSRKYSRNEWAYKHITPKIVIEEFLRPHEGNDLCDYRMYTFQGEVKAINIGSAVLRRHNENVFFDKNWKEIKLTHYQEALPDPLPEKPACFAEMIVAARTLGEGIDFLRMDFYDTTKGVILGEITVYPGGGRLLTSCPVFNKWLGDQWKISSLDALKALLVKIVFGLRKRLRNVFGTGPYSLWW